MEMTHSKSILIYAVEQLNQIVAQENLFDLREARKPN